MYLEWEQENSIQFSILFPLATIQFLFVNIEEELYFTNEGIHLTMKNNIKGEYGWPLKMDRYYLIFNTLILNNIGN